MVIERVQIVSPFGLSKPARISPDTRTFQGVVNSRDFPRVLAKQVTEAELIREVVCNRLADWMGLSVPMSFVVDTQGSTWGTRFRFVYASVIQGEYSAFVRTLRDTRVSRDYLLEWPQVYKAAVFDEWIANGDRTSENLLFAGKGRFLLIDHEDGIPPFAQVDSSTQKNHLLSHLNERTTRNMHTRDLIQHRIRDVLEQLETLDVRTFQDSLPASSWARAKEIRKCIDFLTERQPHLPSLIRARFQFHATSLFG